MFPIKLLLNLAIWLTMLAIFGSVAISWLRQFRVNVPYSHPLVRLIEETADLMLRPIRRHLPVAGGGFDFSPAVAIVILYVLLAIVNRIP